MNNFDEKIFLTCLEAMDAGEDPESILSRYPEQADAIRQLLALDEGLVGLSDGAPAGAQARSEKLFLAQASAMRSVASRVDGRSRWWRPLFAAFASLVLVLAISFGALQASADSLPGDIFYPVKRLNETTQLRLVNDLEDKEQLEERLEDERVREITELLRLGRDENVTCSGEIELLAFDYVQVYGLRVETNDNTVIIGELALGATANVEGYTEDGRYFADKITIVTPAAPGVRESATPEHTATPTAESTLEIETTETPDATQTSAATPTLRATIMATATDAPVTPTEEPTSESTPDDDDDDDECDSSGPGNDCEDEEDEEDDDDPDDPDEEDDCDSSGSGNNCDDDDDDGSGNSGSGSSGSGNSGSGGDSDD